MTKKTDSGWNWAYIIPILALMIPIVAIAGDAIGNLAIGLGIVAAVALALGGTRALMAYRHELRMKELEAKRDIARIEAGKLDRADRILAADDQLAQLRAEVEKERRTTT